MKRKRLTRARSVSLKGKKTCTATTQTNVLREPYVLLEKLNIPVSEFPNNQNVVNIGRTSFIKKRVNFKGIRRSTRSLGTSKEIGLEEVCEFSSVVGPFKYGSHGMSRLPRSYNTFAQPITNNEKANSTLQDITAEITSIEDVVSQKQRKSTNHKSKNVEKTKPKLRKKSESKCSTEKPLSIENFQIPVVLQATDLERSLIISNSVIEQSFQEDSVPNLSESLDPINIEEIPLNMGIRESHVQTQNRASEIEKNLKNVNTRRVNVRLTFENITVSTSQSQRRTDAHSVPSPSTSNNNNNNNFRNANESQNTNSDRSARYIQISGNTVHIHNHFYS